ncbi:MAG: hypothetical protein ACLQSR_13960 [Limisphaerales bacterium]
MTHPIATSLSPQRGEGLRVRGENYIRASLSFLEGQGGRKPADGCREKTNSCALADILYTLIPTEIQIVEGTPK